MRNLSHLRYFDAVCQARSIRQAAEALNVAQSAVSRQIKNLEDEIGMPLFIRHPRGVRLTDAGVILAKYTRSTMLNMDRMSSEIDDLRALRRGTIKLCTVEAGLIDIVPAVVAAYRSKYPAVKIAVSTRGTQGVVDAILEDEADLGLAFNAPFHPEITSLARRQQQLYATVSPSHPLAKLKKIKLAELLKHDIALPETSFGIRQLVDDILHRSEAYIEPVLTTDSIQMLVNFARMDLGVAFLPYFAIKGNLAAGQVQAIPIADIPARNARVEIIAHKGRRLPIPAEEFLQELNTAFKQL
ncbi:LysR family transcriptional regulator [Pelagibius sp. CAU 1746]|uniref:LysR family transcriptional regulator n=1 Tax=Pelagibius sp. CAU 1746 TaxID=3140370 RepID=UPI00325A7CC4